MAGPDSMRINATRRRRATLSQNLQKTPQFITQDYFLTLVTFFVCIAQLTGWFHWMCQGYLNKLF
jgi:hypothetical protein